VATTKIDDIDFADYEAPIAAICKRYGVRLLAVFGSAARGEARPDSDIDFLVEFDAEREVGFLTLGRLARELALVYGRRVDLVPRGGLKPTVAAAVAADSRIVYTA
jgi:predicted nucleotidyltransferase